MKGNIFTSAFVLAVFVTTSFVSQDATAQVNSPSVNILVEYRPDRGAASFSVHFTSLHLGTDVTLTAPDGTLFERYPKIPLSAVNLTEAELTSRFAGAWTINDSWQLPAGTPTQHHQFTIAASVLTTLQPVPQLISPPDGAHLPAEFDMVHTGAAYSLLINGGSPGSGNLNHINLSPFSKYFPLVVEGRSWNSKGVDLGDATPLDPSPLKTIRVGVGGRSFSAPHTWVVGVPEPSTLALGSVALLSLVALRRREPIG